MPATFLSRLLYFFLILGLAVSCGKSTKRMSLEDLVEAAAQGDEAAMEELGKRTMDKLDELGDAHRYRLGVNHDALPVNAPKATIANNYYRAGQMRFDGNGGGAPNYEPNSFGGPAQDPSAAEPPLALHGDADRYDHRDGNDDYTQAGNLYRMFDDGQRDRLAAAIAGSMDGVPQEIIDRQLAHFDQADEDYGKRVRAALNS